MSKRIARAGIGCLIMAAALLAAAPAIAEGERPFSFRPDLPERSPAPAAQQRAYGYDSALRNEIRRLEQRREPLRPGSANRLHQARGELQRLRNAQR